MAISVDTKRFQALERVMRGAANQRRIKILFALSDRPRMNLAELARACGISDQNAAEQTRRLFNADLIEKQRLAQSMLHTLSPLGEAVLDFLKTLRPAMS